MRNAGFEDVQVGRVRRAKLHRRLLVQQPSPVAVRRQKPRCGRLVAPAFFLRPGGDPASRGTHHENQSGPPLFSLRLTI